MPTTITEPVRTGEYIVGDEEDYRSRDVAVIASAASASATVPAGTVLGKITASGKLVPVAPAASVNGNKLTWPAGITDSQKATATAQLTALGIITRV
jgi:hypothetical protein